MLEYSVLGPLEVTGQDGARLITGRNERVVLAVLVGWEGDIVSAERLIDALWGDEPPRSGTKVLQNLVMRLRKVLGSNAISTRPGGYALVAGPDAVDVRRFDRLVATGRAAAHADDWEASANALAAALGLRRGQPLVELEHWSYGRAESARLEEQHRCVVEEFAEAELACGRQRERLAMLYAMVSDEPLRERRWALLMLALYLCGQQAEALRSYQRASAELGELGLTPGAELRALERAISADDLSIGPATLGRLRLQEFPATTPLEHTWGVGSVPARPGAAAGNLPSQLTSFVGRAADLGGVAAALRHSRLVTITGPGGVGKTRLVIRVASDVAADYPYGTWLCELAAVTSAGEIADGVAAALGVRSRPGLTMEQSVVDRLRDTELLLVLDNCEHLLDGACRFTEHLLHSCPQVRVLATSRERLGAAGEQVWPLASLAVPDPSAPYAQGQTDAVTLFADRARSVKPSFAIGRANTAAVDEICCRLDGIPLAIELAAARVAVMTPTEIAAHLDARFRLLRGAGAASDQRHRTLRAALDWSYSLLDDVERTVFNRLCVFSGRFDVAAAISVAAHTGVEPIDVIDALGELVTKSMVATAEDGASEITRYLLLETFRHYALERLQSTNAEWEARRRHASYYADLAEETGRSLRGDDELTWRSRFRADRDNLRAAVSWALASDVEADRQYGLRIIAALAHESMQEGEPIGVFAETALVHSDAAPSGTRAAVLAGAAWFVHRRGDVAAARELCLAALRNGVNDCPAPEMAYFVLALTAMPDGARQAEIFEDGHRALDAAGSDDYSHGFLWSAELYMQLIVGGTGTDATGRESLRLARQIGNPSLLVRVLCNLAALTWLDDPNVARNQLEEADALAAIGASAHMLGFGWPILATLRSQDDDREGARQALRAAIERCYEDSDPFMLSTALDRGIRVLENLGQIEDAATWAGAVVDGVLSRAAHLPAREHPLRVEAIDRLRRSLGEDVYTAAAARGARMSDYELIRHGLAALAG